MAAKLLATRRETMRLRSKIRELKEQHSQLRELRENQQLQLADATAGMLQCCALSCPGNKVNGEAQDCCREHADKLN